MINLYYIPNPTAYKVVKAIIFENTKNEEHIAIVNRPLNINYSIFDIKINVGNFNLSTSWGNIFKFQKNARKLEQFLRSEINSDFRLFVPHTNSILLQILSNSIYCNEINIIHEGMLSYYKKEIQTKYQFIYPLYKILLFDIKLRLFSMNNFRIHPYIDQKHYKINTFYCSEKLSFSGFDNTSLIEVPKPIPSSFYSDKLIYILPNLNRLNSSFETYFNNLNKILLNLYKQFNQELILKFHPAQYSNLAFINDVIEKLNAFENLSISRFNLNENIFNVILSNKNTIVSTRSSLLIEASLNNIITYSDWYLWNNKNKSHFWKHFSQEITKNIIFI